MRTRRVFFSLATVLVIVGALFGAAGAALAAQPGPDVWTGGPVPPWANWRFDGEYYAPQGRIYFLGGRTGGAATIDPSVKYFDVATNTYVTTTADMPTGVANYHIVQLTDSTGVGLYIFGGSTSTGAYSTAVQVYYPETNTAMTVAGDTWPGVNADGCVDFPGAGIAYNNKAYLLGGFNGSCATPGVSNETWIYDPMAPAGSRFTLGPALNLARGYVQVAIVDNFMYAMGGDEYPGTLVVTPIAERLDLGNPSATWDDAGVADMPVLTATGVAGCDEVEAFGFNTVSGTELKGKIVIAGCGQWVGTGTSAYADSFMYDVATNTWSAWEPLATAVRNYAGALAASPAGVTIWAFGGSSDGLNGMAVSQYRNVALAPTSVNLTAVSSHSEPATPLWALGVAGLALLAATGVGVFRARAARS